jgi:hypothetical protein
MHYVNAPGSGVLTSVSARVELMEIMRALICSVLTLAKVMALEDPEL